MEGIVAANSLFRGKIRRMRTTLIVVAAAAALAASPSTPQKIVFARVFPNAGQIGLFVAAADGSGERPLLDTPGMDYDAGVVARRRVDRLHLGSRRLGGFVSRRVRTAADSSG